MTHGRIAGAMLATALFGCNVPDPPKPTGGVHVDAAVPPGDAATGVDGSAAATCGRGVVVVEGYGSTNVGLVAEDGRVLSGSFASSRTTSVGLAAPLSGDVVPPTMPVNGDRIVLLDRTASRIVWVDVANPDNRTELSVGPGGFYANPHDYAEISATKAYVTRYASNPVPGQQPFDRGSDVLVVDPSAPSIVGAIDVTSALGSDAARALPRPDLIVFTGSRAIVLLGALPLDFSVGVPSRLVAIDTTTDTMTDVLTLDGFANCTGLALSPTKTEVIVLCSGNIADPYAPSDLTGSGVVRVDVKSGLRVSQKFPGADLGPGPAGFFAAYATPSTLVFPTFGYLNQDQSTGRADTLIQLDLEAGTKTTLLTGAAFTLGGVACDPLCRTCFAADAGLDGGVVHRFTVDDHGGLVGDQPIKVERSIGLPPRYVGRF
jgi:hypothetical protein